MNDLHLKQRIFEGFFILVGLLLVGAIACTIANNPHPPEKPYCEQFADTPMRDLPAKCIRYWQ